MTQASDSASSGNVREREFELFFSNCHRVTLYDVPKSPADRFCFVGWKALSINRRTVFAGSSTERRLSADTDRHGT